MGTLWGQVQKSPEIGQKMSKNRSDKGPKIVLNPPWKNCLDCWKMEHLALLEDETSCIVRRWNILRCEKIKYLALLEDDTLSVLKTENPSAGTCALRYMPTGEKGKGHAGRLLTFTKNLCHSRTECVVAKPLLLLLGLGIASKVGIPREAVLKKSKKNVKRNARCY